MNRGLARKAFNLKQSAVNMYSPRCVKSKKSGFEPDTYTPMLGESTVVLIEGRGNQHPQVIDGNRDWRYMRYAKKR